MQVYTVRKLPFNTDTEYQAYLDLLEEIGVDLSSAPRVHEPGTSNHWLYVWHRREEAERFARILGDRLRDPSFMVHSFEIDDEERGPIAPLIIRSRRTSQGIIFRMDEWSQRRVMRHFPNALLSGEVPLPGLARTGRRAGRGSALDQVARSLTGLDDSELAGLGGFRVFDENGRLLHERVPVESFG